MLRKPDGTPKGYGFVTFEDEVTVEKCLVMSHSLGGKDVDVKRAHGRSDGGGGGGMGGQMGGMNRGARGCESGAGGAALSQRQELSAPNACSS